MVDLSEGKRKHAKSEQALYSGPCVAYNVPLPQKGVSAEVCQGSAGLARLAFRGQEALWDCHPQLRRYFQPRASSHL